MEGTPVKENMAIDKKCARPLFVTRPALPPVEEYVEYIRRIWESGILTNNGPFHRRLEQELAEYLGVNHLSLFANGTLALVTALQVLGIKGEVITTPFSFVATSHALRWSGIRPVFVDIEEEYCNLDPEKIEVAITPETTAILPVHVYGNPCKVERIQEIADVHGLKVIYDSAHAFGVALADDSVLNFGDLSILSFHATKTFHTFEGGAIVSHDESTKQRIDYFKNFGFAGETSVVEPGINAKMNEMQAALGLLQLQYVDGYIARCAQMVELYRERLSGVKGLRFLRDMRDVRHGYSFFPIFIDEAEYGMSRDVVYERFKEQAIYCRRYFYPLISSLPMYRDLPSAGPGNLPVAGDVASQVLCLPLYPDLEQGDVERVCRLLADWSEE